MCNTANEKPALGFSLHEVLTYLKAQPLVYTSIDISYAPSQPLTAPVVLDLPANGIRLRFDGPEQTLRLIEVLEFSRTQLSYKNVDFVKVSEQHATSSVGPAFRHVYNTMGPTFPGEYLPPALSTNKSLGLYVLSYPGIAFSFPLQDAAWNSERDYVSLLSSNAALPAKSFAIFDGSSWQDVRDGLFHPRIHLASSPHRTKDHRAEDIELVKVCGNGILEMARRTSGQFRLLLGETTAQDLVTELGAPDAIYYKNDRRLSIHRTRRQSNQEHQRIEPSLGIDNESTDSDRSSTHNSSDSSEEEGNMTKVTEKRRSLPAECFYNYFHHGFDIFISYPKIPSPAFPSSVSYDQERPRTRDADHLVATKIHLHGNVPGSYPFNRYRRIRWAIDTGDPVEDAAPLNSETPFRSLSESLQQKWKAIHNEDLSLEKPMVFNRDWGDSPGSSCELLGGWEEHADKTKGGSGFNTGTLGAGTTQLYGFPGLVFEVLKNDFVNCLTVY